MSDAEALHVRGGLLTDVTGAALREADLRLKDGRVQALLAPGELADDGSRRVLDARDRVVAPGFIDVHSHADNAPLLSEDDTTKLRQGVTTEVVGNCGFSLAPVTAGHAVQLRRLLERLFSPLELGWASSCSRRSTRAAR